MLKVRSTTFLFILIYPFIVIGQISIKGQIELDSTWRNDIFISEILSLNDMYKCSGSMIIGQSKIDSLGYWDLTIPNQDQPKLFRLHVSKKDYPEASLIIGGKDENYGFIGVYNNKHLTYSKREGGKILNDFSMDDPLNTNMRRIKSMADTWDTTDRLTANRNAKHALRTAYIDTLIHVSDTSTAILPAIYAAYVSDFGFNKKDVRNTMSKIKHRLGDHLYLNDYTSKNPFPYSVKILLLMVLGLSLLWMGIKLTINYRERLKTKRLYTLTVREKEIFNLIDSGKTNKEISATLNIEISTVKRHINNIFNKLKITSRHKINSYTKK